MKVTLGNLMRRGLGDQRDSELERALRRVLHEFAHRVDRGHPVPWPPDFLPPGRGVVREVDVRLDPEAEATLRREAAHLGITVDALAGHAILVSLAAREALESSLWIS